MHVQIEKIHSALSNKFVTENEKETCYFNNTNNKEVKFSSIFGWYGYREATVILHWDTLSQEGQCHNLWGWGQKQLVSSALGEVQGIPSLPSLQSHPNPSRRRSSGLVKEKMQSSGSQNGFLIQGSTIQWSEHFFFFMFFSVAFLLFMFLVLREPTYSSCLG